MLLALGSSQGLVQCSEAASGAHRTHSHRRPDGDDAGDPSAAAEADDDRRPQLRAGGERRRGSPTNPQTQPRCCRTRARCLGSGGRRRLLHEVRLPNYYFDLNVRDFLLPVHLTSCAHGDNLELGVSPRGLMLVGTVTLRLPFSFVGGKFV